jgi:SAM-dependent methyltransferase
MHVTKSYNPKPVSEKDQHLIAGNSLSKYVQAEEINPINSYLHLDTVHRIFSDVGRPIRVLDLGSGNGVNSRLILRTLRSMEFRGQIEITYCDYFSENLNAAIDLSLKYMPDECFRSIQIDLTDSQSLENFIKDESDKFDVIFSVKFLHNTPIKINKLLATSLARLVRPGGFFVLQAYLEKSRWKRFKNFFKVVLGIKFPNTTWFELALAKFWMNKSGFSIARVVTMAACGDHLNLNHFRHTSQEIYFIKDT